MQKIIHKHTISFKHAYEGIIYVFTSQPNYRIHLTLSFLALFWGWYYQISYVEWLTIVLLITIGLVVETINTAFEAVTDCIDLSWRPDIKIAKDAAAGAMLIFSVGALFIACIIFIPKILI